jgi:thiol-disulfide isomerase/thioredoxin
MKSGLLRWTMLAGLLLSSLGHADERASAWQGVGVDHQPIHFDPGHMQRPAVLLFWATWCPYCKALMPYVQHVLDAAGAQRLDVYAIDIKEDDDADPAAELRQRGLTFTLVRDGDSIAEQYGVKGTPGLFLVDAQGRIVYRRIGGDSPDKVEAALRERLHLH